MLIVDSADAGDSSFYLSRALAIGKAPAFNVEIGAGRRASARGRSTRAAS